MTPEAVAETPAEIPPEESAVTAEEPPKETVEEPPKKTEEEPPNKPQTGMPSTNASQLPEDAQNVTVKTETATVKPETREGGELKKKKRRML